MAYYDDGYGWPQERTTYDLVPYQDSVSFSDYEAHDLDTYDANTVSEFHDPKFIDHYNHLDDYGYSYSYARPEINYFAYNYVEPKLIAYEPVACDMGYVSYHTQHSVSYSTTDSGFNEPEFEEYDPTPYGGGYDIVSVYGKPLPPSDLTCYPRSTPKSIEPMPKPSPELEPEPRSSPEPLPKSKPKPELEPKPEPEPEPLPVSIPAPTPIPLVEPEPKPEPKLEPEPEPLELGNSYPGYVYDYPWPEYDHGYGIGVGYDYGHGKQVVQVPPCEYDPEVVDFCEGIFGNWPCLDRIRNQQTGIASNPETAYPENRHHDPWQGCANYIFGGPIVPYNQ